MADDDGRRRFIQMLAAAPGAAVAGTTLLGSCRSSDGGGGADGRTDTEPAGDVRGGDAADTTDTADATDAGGLDAAEVAGDGGDATAACEAGDGGAGADAGSGVDPENCEVTGSDVEGPFYVDGAPQRRELAGPDEPGQRLLVEGTVYGPDCETPVSGALLDIWHANDAGAYYDADDNYRLRGQLMTDEEGRYSFETVRPGNYRVSGGLRPAHIHFAVTEPAYRPLTTQLYFSDDPHLAPDDPCAGCSSGDETLIIDVGTTCRDGERLQHGVFDIVLEDA